MRGENPPLDKLIQVRGLQRDIREDAGGSTTLYLPDAAVDESTSNCCRLPMTGCTPDE